MSQWWGGKGVMGVTEGLYDQGRTGGWELGGGEGACRLGVH